MSIDVDGIVITDKQVLQAYNAFMKMSLEEKINMVSLTTTLSVERIKKEYTIGQVNDLFKINVIRPFIERVTE